MKTIGLIGGMSWESSLEYYRVINEVVKEKLGGLHSAKCLMVSVDFAEIEQMQHEGRWGDAAKVLVKAAQDLEKGGADFLVLCTNTMHLSAPEIIRNVTIPFLHIADATAEKIKQDGYKKIGLLGTKFTMEQDFYKGRLTDRYGLEVLIPDEEQRDLVHQVIYNELCLGRIEPSSRQQYIKIIESLKARGAEAVILGCTEIELLVKQSDSPLKVYPTTTIHAISAVEAALA
jgi:aspartate racemase